MKARCSTPWSTRQQGVALIAVLWLVAAMSLIIAGVVQSVRTEIRTAGQQRQSVVAGGLADASILLALQKLHAMQIEPRAGLQVIPVAFEGVSRPVQVLPVNGLIDINNAPVALLTDMYRLAGGFARPGVQLLQLFKAFDALHAFAFVRVHNRLHAFGDA